MKKAKQFAPDRSGLESRRRFDGQAHWKEMYDSQWEDYRRRYLAINQSCYSCGQRSEVVDHLVPAKGDERLFRKLDNHIPLCKSCHNTVTAKFDRRYRPGDHINQKLQWIANNRLKFDLTFRVKVLPKY